MDKINFQNLPNTTTAVNAANLNLLQDNVDNGKEDKMISSTWTPTLNTIENAAPTVTYTTRSGHYYKIGSLVFISFYIRGTITALTGTNNFATITGLPVAPRGVSLGENVLSTGVVYNCIQDDTAPVILDISGSGNRIQIQNSSGSGALKWKVTPTSGYFELGGSGWYELP